MVLEPMRSYQVRTLCIVYQMDTRTFCTFTLGLHGKEIGLGRAIAVTVAVLMSAEVELGDGHRFTCDKTVTCSLIE